MKICESKDCRQCGACMNICPNGAIILKLDEKGFYKPVINNEKCSECGLCKKICMSTRVDSNSGKIYAAKLKDHKMRERSSSGGMFVWLSDIMLQLSGVIYGADMDSELSVFHNCAINETQRNRLIGSKYVSSRMDYCYQLVKEDLLKNEEVLFVGTPCQCEALIKYLDILRVSRDKLLTCDLLCHGCPSVLVYQRFIKRIEKKYCGRVIGVRFRDKKFVYKKYGKVTSRGIVFQLEYSDGSIQDVFDEKINNQYYELFKHNLINNEACSKCTYTNYNRIGDFSIGDFWGIENSLPYFQDNRGISLLFVNNRKAKEIFERYKYRLEYIECKPEDCVQSALCHPIKKSKFSRLFYFLYPKIGVSAASNICMTLQWTDFYRLILIRKLKKNEK